MTPGTLVRPIAFFGLAVAAFCASGCATASAQRSRPVSELIDGLHEDGFDDAQNPFALSLANTREVQDTITRHGTPIERLQRVLDSINGVTGKPFTYLRDATLGAQESFRSRTGDCMTYAALAVATARALEVPVYFVYVADLPVHYDDGGWVFSAAHMALGMGTGVHSLVVDVTGQGEGLSSSVYQAVDDATAATLFFNNKAVARLVAGDPAGAEKMLRRLLLYAPEVRDTWANLGAVLLQEKRPEEALALSQQALARFPDYRPLWANAVRAARSLGDETKANELEAQAAVIAEKDPYFQFVRGVTAYEDARFAEAVTALEKSANGMADGALVKAWLVRAYLASGQPQKGWDLFAQLRGEFPGDRNLDALAQEFPLLALAERAESSAPAEVRSHRYLKKVLRKP